MADKPTTTRPPITRDGAALTDVQRDGLACVICGADHTVGDVAAVPVGMVDGAQVFACAPCAEHEELRDRAFAVLRRVRDEHGRAAARLLVDLLEAYFANRIGDEEMVKLGRGLVWRGECGPVAERLNEVTR